MPSGSSNPKADIVLALAVIALAVVLYIGTLSLPPAKWEPLGSAAVPRGLCVIMSCLAAVVLARAVLTLRKGAPKVRAAVPLDAEEAFERRPWTAVVMFGLVVLYVAAMDFHLLGFVEATVAFLVALGLVFTRARRRHIPWIVGFALIIAVGNYLVFTHFLYVDLPVVEWF